MQVQQHEVTGHRASPNQQPNTQQPKPMFRGIRQTHHMDHTVGLNRSVAGGVQWSAFGSTCCRSTSVTCNLLLSPAGRTTSTSCMAYLDSGFVFLGSRGGDSQLIRLHDTPLPPQPSADAADAAGTAAATPAAAAADDPMGVATAGGSSEAAAAAAADDGPNYVEVVDSWPSLAPILDFAVVDLERQGQGQVGGFNGTGWSLHIWPP